jgi:parallel beta-helix repeat protein
MRRAFVLAIVILAVTIADAPCRTWLIRPDGSGDAPSIKAAIYYGADGDTVLLEDGTYTGRDNTEVSYRGKAIVVMSQSQDPHACVIDCEGSELNWSRGFLFYHGEGEASVLAGVTVKNGYGYEGGGIWCWGSSPTISNVILSGNTALYSGGGIYCGGGSSPEIRNVTVFGNEAAEGGGLHCLLGASPVIENTIIAYNLDGGSLTAGDSECSPMLGCCDIYGNVGGDWTSQISEQYGIAGNISLDPLFCLQQNPERPLTVDSNSPCAPAYRFACESIGAAGIGCWSGVSADIEIEPDVLNPKSRGQWLTCYIELEGGLDPEDIDVATVVLNDSIPAAMLPTEVGDHDGDGVADRMVKFSRGDLINTLAGPGDVEVQVSGQVGALTFAGTDTIKVLSPGKNGEQLAAGPGTVEQVFNVLGEDVPTGTVRIRFDIFAPGDAALSVYDVQGRLVKCLFDAPVVAETYVVDWDGLDSRGAKVAGGVYFLRLDTETGVSTGKAIINR